jgi:hypothetical protein
MRDIVLIHIQVSSTPSAHIGIHRHRRGNAEAARRAGQRVGQPPRTMDRGGVNQKGSKWQEKK